jgi:hypothetical protein
MTRHGVNLVLSISACELAPGAPRLQGARPLGDRGMSLVGTFETSRHVRSSAATGGKSDISPTTHFGSGLDPKHPTLESTEC